MTDFLPIRFDPARCAVELDELAALLRVPPLIAECRQILPFFRARPHLTAFLGSYHRDLTAYDGVAYELRLFGPSRPMWWSLIETLRRSLRRVRGGWAR